MDVLTHLVNFGMVVVLWLVQLIIYPSFLRIEADKLVDWHKVYTFRVSFVIIPLMFGQMGLWLFSVYQAPNVTVVVGLLLVVICWILTFTISVPLHRKVERGEGSETVLRALIGTNWYRTVCWTGVFVIGLFPTS
ncbi:MAG: hypothetical protein ACSHYA_16625 [Opitutaceae bacterium]